MLKLFAALRQPLLARYLDKTSWATKAVAILIGSLILAASAHIQVPMYPVPMTMQTYAVLIVAALGGRTIGLGAIAAYLLEGAMGLPVFTSAGGFFGPTGGFLVGFLLSGAIAAFAAERGLLRGWISGFAALTVAHLAVFIPGVLWLANFVGLEKAFAVGFLPFIAGTVLKTGLAVLTVRKADAR